MIEGNQLNEKCVGQFLATFYFGESNPLNSAEVAGSVIDWVDRGLPPFDTLTCEKIKSKLKQDGIDLDAS